MRRIHLSHYQEISHVYFWYKRNNHARFEWTSDPKRTLIIPRGYKYYLSPKRCDVYYYEKA